jgi:hypothetical protein
LEFVAIRIQNIFMIARNKTKALKGDMKPKSINACE